MEDAFTGTNDPIGAEAPEQDVQATESAAPGGEQTQVEGEAPPQAEAAQGTDPLKGTPFKDVGGLVKSYKEIQRLVSSKDQQISQLTEHLKQAITYIQSQRGGQQPQTPQGPSPQGEQFWDAFAKDPVGVLNHLVEERAGQLLQSRLDQRLGPIQQTVGRYEIESEVGTFMRRHPEFSDKDEDEMMEVLQANPHLKEVPNRLEIAYDQMLAKRWRSDRARSSQQAAVSGAKGVAALGGKKSVVPAQGPKDPFDDVLDLDKSQRELYNLGRKQA